MVTLFIAGNALWQSNLVICAVALALAKAVRLRGDERPRYCGRADWLGAPKTAAFLVWRVAAQAEILACFVLPVR
jgi:hypothetical protein